MNAIAIEIKASAGLDQTDRSAIDEAALWVAARPAGALPSPIVPHLGGRFGLTVGEARVALREAALISGRAH